MAVGREYWFAPIVFSAMTMTRPLTAVVVLAVALLIDGCARAKRDASAVAANGVGPTVRVESGSIPSASGCELEYLRYLPHQAAAQDLVVLGHGFLRSKARMARLAGRLAQECIPAVAMDFCNMRFRDGGREQPAKSHLGVARRLRTRPPGRVPGGLLGQRSRLASAGVSLPAGRRPRGHGERALTPPGRGYPTGPSAQPGARWRTTPERAPVRSSVRADADRVTCHDCGPGAGVAAAAICGSGLTGGASQSNLRLAASLPGSSPRAAERYPWRPTEQRIPNMARTRSRPRAPSLVPRKLPRQREQLFDLVRRGQKLAEALGSSSLSTESAQLAASALKPFLFVVVGEVKSGKSSLINALLEEPVCAVDSAPCTTRLQEIRHGRKAQRVQVSEFEERMHLPHEILRHIAVVDTPGTNSIIDEHQVITEEYIPQADLVLFVFFAKNPYTGSAWDFLSYIRGQWERNTLFVLQQTDLVEAPELTRTLALVKQQLVDSGVAEPVVFPVSVQTGEGLDTLREYVRIEVIQGRQFDKSVSLIGNLSHFLRRFEAALRDHECLLAHDEASLGELRRLAVGLGPDADQEYAVLAARVKQLGDDVRGWLANQGDGAGEPPADGAPAGSPAVTQRSFRLGAMRALRNAASTGWEVPLRTLDRLNRLQVELSRCLFRAQLRRLELYRRLRKRLDTQLETISADPPCLAAPLQDELAQGRRASLASAHQALASLEEPEPTDDDTPRIPVLAAMGRWPSFYGAAQLGAGVVLLAFGYYADGLLAGVLLAPAGYLGAGYALAAHSRTRVERYARNTLARSLAHTDRQLRETLLAQPPELQSVTRGALAQLEASVNLRRQRTEDLSASVHDLKNALRRFQSETGASRSEGPR